MNAYIRMAFGNFSSVTKVYKYFGAVNTTVDYKPILKYLIFGLFYSYFHLVIYFDLSIS
jgi:hypothetical protein